MDWIRFFYVFLTNKEIFFSFLEMIPQEIFRSAVKTNLFILIRKFADKYKRMPDFDTLEMLLDNLPELEKENSKEYRETVDQIRKHTSTVDVDVFSDQLTKAIQQWEMEQFILKSANKIDNITPDELMGDIKDIISKFAPKSMGIDVTDVERVMKYMRQDVTDKMSTGIEQLNIALHGGWGSDEIAIVMAPPGKGKSFFLLNAMYYAMLAGHSALYITLEISEKAVLRRLYSRVTYSNRKEMMDEPTVSKTASKFFKLSGSTGRVIYYPGNTLTVASLEAVLDQQLLYFNFKPDLLVVDYLDRLSPRKNDYKSETRHQLRNITDDLRSIAMRYSGMKVITATQANRASLSKEKITEAHISESFGKVEVADVLLALCQTEEEKKKKEGKIYVVKNRDYISGGKIDFYVDFDKMFLSDRAGAVRLGLIESVEEEEVEPAKASV
jgi:KaiC/GvpD/RAD55 family RecA-like ATPase